VERTVIARVVTRREVIKEALAAIEIAGAAIAVSDVPHLSKERCLLPEVGSLAAAEIHIEAVGMTRAVMAGEAVHAEAKEYAPDVRSDFVDPVQPVQAFVIVGIRPKSATSRNVADRIIEGESRGETLRVL